MKTWTRLLAIGVTLAMLPACDAAMVRDLIGALQKDKAGLSGPTAPVANQDLAGLWYGLNDQSGPDQFRCDVKIRLEGDHAFVEVYPPGESGGGPIIAKGDAQLDPPEGQILLAVRLQFDLNVRPEMQLPREAKVDLRGDGRRLEGQVIVTERDGRIHDDPFRLQRERPAGWGGQQPGPYATPAPWPVQTPTPWPYQPTPYPTYYQPTPYPTYHSSTPAPTYSPGAPFPEGVHVLDISSSCGPSHAVPHDAFAPFGILDVAAVPNPWYGTSSNPTAHHWPVIFGTDSGQPDCVLGTLPDGQLPSPTSGYGAAHLRFALAAPVDWIGVEFLGGPLSYRLQTFDSAGAPLAAHTLSGTATANALFLHVEHAGIAAFAIGSDANGGVLIRRMGAR